MTDPSEQGRKASERALPRGRIKASPEDFIVDEIPAYPASGTGEHVFIRFTKTDRTTVDAVRGIARALGCDPREAGFAGMKDKRAVTTQTVSVHAPRGTKASDIASRALTLDMHGIAIHEASPHGHKLKPGHLVGNRFAIIIRDVPSDRLFEVTDALERVAREGVPNAFGGQRFGAAGDNATRALAWLRGQERPPRDRKLLRLLWSALQSTIFNAVLEERVQNGTWATPLLGDLLKLRTSGGLFVCADVQTDCERALTGEVSPTGPILGIHMRKAEGAPAALEQRIAEGILGPNLDLAPTKALGEGTRRPLRTWVQDLRCEFIEEAQEASGGTPPRPSAASPAPSAVGIQQIAREASGSENSGKGTASVRVSFVLPKGAYATTVLATAMAVEETQPEGRNAAREEDPQQEETLLS